MTKRAETRWRVAETETGKPFIVLEPLKGDALSVFDRTVTFDLPEGTSLAEAQDIARFLKIKLIRVAET